MKSMELKGKQKIIALNAVKSTPDGFKGIDRIRAGLRLTRKLEKDLPKDRPLTEEEQTQVYIIKLELADFQLLKTCMDSQQWNGTALEAIEEVYDAMEKAKEEEAK